MSINELKTLPREICLAADTKAYETEKEISKLAGDGRRFLATAKICFSYARSAHDLIAERHKK